VNVKTAATPLLVVLLGVEVSDLIFALDSIPAILAVTLDPFIVYTSNVFAIMGLRSMYFVLAGAVHKFVYLRTALGLVLGFVGVKMLLAETRYKIDTIAALGIITATLGAGLLASWVHNRRRSSSVSERG
jgi:tellurite resistance protein TerC